MFVSKASLCSLAALIGIVAAGPKHPRSFQNVPRAYTNSSGVSLNILTKTGVKNATAPNLYGWMFEDINHSGDGGLYGEMLTNRAFDGSDITWGTIPGFNDNSIVYQENSCEAFGTLTTTNAPFLTHQVQAPSLQDTNPWETRRCVWTICIT
jgi:alpha-N-arabinofuranosidase